MNISKEQVKKFAEEGKISYAVIERAFANMSGEGGKFFRMMDSQSKTAGGRLATMFDNLRALGEKFGVAMLPAINSVISLGSSLLEKLLPVVNAIAPAFKWFGENLTSILTVVGPLTGAIAAYAVVTKLQALWAAKATIAQWALNVAMNANPIGLIVAGIALLVGGLILAYKKSETFRAVLHGTWEVLKLGWDWIKKIALILWEWVPIIAVVREGVKALADVFTWIWPVIKNVFVKVKTWIVETFGGVFKWLIDQIKAFAGFLGKFADKLRLTSIVNKIQNAFNKGASGEITVKDETGESSEAGGGKEDALSTLTKPKTPTSIASSLQATAKDGAGEKLAGVKADERATRNITVQIDKLIGEMSFNSSTFQESASDLREKVKKVLIDAVRDTELSF